MTEERRVRFKLISLFLQFPDDDLTGFLGPMEEAVETLPMGKPREIFERMLSHFREKSLLELQEEYTRVFDLSPSTSLNLTYHQWGDDKRRGEALVALSSTYRSAGYETASNELPDFLPLVLEFLSVAPEQTGTRLRNDFSECISSLGSRLKETGSIYASLLDALQ